MAKREEPAWKAELEAQIRKFDAFGMPFIVPILEPFIRAAEQRGFQAGVNKTGDTVGKLREELKTAKADALRDAAQNLRNARLSSVLGETRFTINEAAAVMADLIDPDKP